MSLLRRNVRAGSPAALAIFAILMLAAPAAVAQDYTPITPPSSPPPPSGGGGGSGGGGTSGNVAPVISSITAVQVAGQKFRIYGKVTDDTPSSCGVVLSGAASGVVLCDSSGNFDGVFNVATPGPATAVAGDGQLQSAPVNLALANAAPMTTVTAVHGANGIVTFSGKVTDEVPAGLTVTLAGGPGLGGTFATVLADGTWSVSVTLPIGASGMVAATVTDWYGLTGTGYTTY